MNEQSLAPFQTDGVGSMFLIEQSAFDEAPYYFLLLGGMTWALRSRGAKAAAAAHTQPVIQAG